MADAHQQTIRDALHSEPRPLMLLRMRRTLYIAIAGLVLSAVSDMRLSPIPYDLICVKLEGSILQGGAILLIGLASRSSWRRSATVAVIAWSVSCAVVSFNGYYTGDSIMPTLLLPVMVTGAGMLF